MIIQIEKIMSLSKYLEEGALFERLYATALRCSFPNYEQFWSKYIGTETMEGMTVEETIGGIEDKDRKRKLLGQYLYSALVDYFAMRDIQEELSNYNEDDFFKWERNYRMSVYLAHHALEQLEYLRRILGQPKEIEFQKRISRLRTTIIHYTRPLIGINAKEFQVISLDSVDNLPSADSESHPLWSELNPTSYDFISFSSFLQILCHNLSPHINNAIGDCLTWAADHRIPEIQREDLESTQKFPGPSGSVGES